MLVQRKKRNREGQAFRGSGRLHEELPGRRLSERLGVKKKEVGDELNPSKRT